MEGKYGLMRVHLRQDPGGYLIRVGKDREELEERVGKELTLVCFPGLTFLELYPLLMTLEISPFGFFPEQCVVSVGSRFWYHVEKDKRFVSPLFGEIF